MTLKHLTRLDCSSRSPSDGVIYINEDGAEVEAIPDFRRFLKERGYPFDTVRRYEGSATRFIDFLIECKVFGQPSTPAEIADAMQLYPMFLRDGAGTIHSKFASLGAYATTIGIPHGIARNSMLPTLAGVNHFLNFAKDVALRSVYVLQQNDCEVDLRDLALTFRSIDGREDWSQHQKERFRNETMLGGVVRIQERLTRPKGLRKAIHGKRQVDLEKKDFPLLRLPELFAQARSRREATLWSLLAGGGLRMHEAMNMLVTDIDPETQGVWVVDPDDRRVRYDMNDRDKIRFKGRNMSRVFMYEPLRSFFWNSLEAYLKEEFLPTDTHDFLFQKLDGVGRGQPLWQASDTARIKPFKDAVIRAKIPGPPEAPDHVYSPHALRHSFGVYMLNYIPQPEGFGLSLTEVQQLMGHSDPRSTSVYARHDQILLESRIELADKIISMSGPSASPFTSLYRSIASKLRAEADRFEAWEEQAATSEKLAWLRLGKPHMNDAQ